MLTFTKLKLFIKEMKFYPVIVRLYAESLYEFLEEKKILKKASPGIAKLLELFSNHDNLLNNISAPMYSEREQLDFLYKISQELSLAKEIDNFFHILAHNKRLSILKDILEMFLDLQEEKMGTKIVEITISKDISDKEKQTLIKKIEESLKSKIKPLYKIDENIIGGVVFKFENKMYDASLKKKFAQLNNIVENKIAIL